MKSKSILPFNWLAELENFEVYSIDNDFILLDKPIITNTFNYPFKMDVTVVVICLKGTTEGTINLKPYATDGACFITILPGQIIEYKSVSKDFSGLFMVLSPQFTDSLMPNAMDRLPLSLSVRENPVITLNEGAVEGMINYFDLLKKVICVDNHPYRLEVARYLTLAFFYGAGFNFHNVPKIRNKTHHETLFEKFLHTVQDNYKQHRRLEFYAGKLCVTSKHLSKIAKEISGKSANNWIDDYVALEAKALLKSTNKSIEQISDELNFPSQSFFGKYFKRVVGMSPRAYKGKG